MKPIVAVLLLVFAQTQGSAISGSSFSKHALTDLLQSLFPDTQVGLLNGGWESDQDSQDQRDGNGVTRTFEFDKNSIVKQLIRQTESSQAACDVNEPSTESPQSENLRLQESALTPSRVGPPYLKTVQQENTRNEFEQFKQPVFPGQQILYNTHESPLPSGGMYLEPEQFKPTQNVAPQPDVYHDRAVSAYQYKQPAPATPPNSNQQRIEQLRLRNNEYIEQPQQLPQLQLGPGETVHNGAYQSSAHRQSAATHSEPAQIIPNYAPQQTVYPVKDLTTNVLPHQSAHETHPSVNQKQIQQQLYVYAQPTEQLPQYKHHSEQEMLNYVNQNSEISSSTTGYTQAPQIKPDNHRQLIKHPDSVYKSKKAMNPGDILYRPSPRVDPDYVKESGIANNELDVTMVAYQRPQHEIPSHVHRQTTQEATSTVQRQLNIDSHPDHNQPRGSENSVHSQKRPVLAQQDQSKIHPKYYNLNSHNPQNPEVLISSPVERKDELEQGDSQQIQNILAGLLQQLNQSAGGNKNFKIGEVKLMRSS